jgi:hypothetical protein
VIERRSFNELLERDYKMNRLTMKKATTVENSEAKAMLWIHDVWRVVYISVYYYLMPFLVLALSCPY